MTPDEDAAPTLQSRCESDADQDLDRPSRISDNRGELAAACRPVFVPSTTCRAYAMVRPDPARSSTTASTTGSGQHDAIVTCTEAGELLGRSSEFFARRVRGGELAPVSRAPYRLRFGDCIAASAAARRSPRRPTAESGVSQPAPPRQSTQAGRKVRERIERFEAARMRHGRA